MYGSAAVGAFQPGRAAERGDAAAALIIHAQPRDEIDAAFHGREALELALSGTFDLLLLDIHMPEMDGFDVVQAIRDHERNTGKHLPIIAFTAGGTFRYSPPAAASSEFCSRAERPKVSTRNSGPGARRPRRFCSGAISKG